MLQRKDTKDQKQRVTHIFNIRSLSYKVNQMQFSSIHRFYFRIHYLPLFNMQFYTIRQTLDICKGPLQSQAEA